MLSRKEGENLFRLILSVLAMSLSLEATEPITPLPQSIEYDHAKAALGKKLFHDPILSKDGTIACVNCHLLESGGDDGMKFSIGIKGREGTVNSPTVLNSFFNFRQFWDGRAKDLEEQAAGPIENPVEMGHSIEKAVEKLKAHNAYPQIFTQLYPDGVTAENMLHAIAEFEKALITPNAPFDRYLRGEKNAISKEAKKGYQLFKTKGCIICHNGINIGGNLYNKFGIYKESNSAHLGRYHITQREEDRYVFKVPSLRNIALTAPYMHDGRADTLKQAVIIMSQFQLGRYMEPEEIEAIVAFLESLTGEVPKILGQADER
ncbi:MAG: cytochrome-c peroxidase [Sulfurovum sp.]